MTTDNPPKTECRPADKSEEDLIFDTFVAGSGDLRGMIAYCIYRFEKKKIFDGRALPPEEKRKLKKSYITGRKYDDIKNQAAEIVGRYTDNAIKRYSRNKFFREFTVGIAAGVVSALLAPVFWYGVKAAIIHSGAAAQAENLLIRDGGSSEPPSQSLSENLQAGEISE